MKDKQAKYPQLRFKGFTDPWEERKLSELATMNARIGWQNLRTSEFLDNGYYMLITGTDFKAGAIDYSNIHYVEKERFEQDKKIQISNKSILITKDGTLGKVAYVEGLTMPATLNAGVFNVKVKEDLAIDSKYLFHYLKAPFLLKFADQRSTGGTIKHLNQNVLVEFPIPLPSLGEQHKIAGLLSNFDNTIALHQRKLAKLKELKQGYLQKLFPQNGSKFPQLRFAGFADAWEKRKLGAITDSFSGGTPTAGKAEYYGGEIPFIRSGEISSDSTELFITDAGLNNSSAKMVGIGDILYALYGATSGETSISRINGAINQAILAIRPTKGDDPYMIVQWLKKQKEPIISTYLQGGQGNLSGSIVKDLLITLPKNKDEQAKVGSFFKQLDQTITLHQRKLDLLKEQKKGFLQNMFV